MDKTSAIVAIRSVARLLESVRGHELSVLENPYNFSDICDTLEARAKWLRNHFTKRRKKRKFAVRRRIFGKDGKPIRGIEITPEGEVRINRKTVYKPNGQRWKMKDVEAEKAQARNAIKETLGE